MAISADQLELRRFTGFAPKSQVWIGEPFYRDPTPSEALGRISGRPIRLQTEQGLFSKTAAMEMETIKRELSALNAARRAKTISRRDYNERKTGLHYALSTLRG